MEENSLKSVDCAKYFMEQVVERLRRIILDYDVFSSVAEKLDWLDVEEQHEEWRHTYPFGMQIEVYRFPQDYLVLHHVEDAYVRTVLSDMAHYEEWEPGFWEISQEERRHCLKETGMRALCKEYTAFKETRLIQRDWTYLAKEIQYFANVSKVSVSVQKPFLDLTENAKVIELGGWYNGDAEYLAIKRNVLLVVSCGCWD